MASAQRAYRAYDEYDYAYAPERERRTRVRVVPGTGASQKTASPSLVTIAKIAIVAMVVLAVLSIVRIGLSSAAVTSMIEGDTISSNIEDARAEGTELEVAQTSLSSPSTLKAKAKDLKMSAPSEVGTIALDKDVVAVDAEGNLSLSGSVQALTES